MPGERLDGEMKKKESKTGEQDSIPRRRDAIMCVRECRSVPERARVSRSKPEHMGRESTSEERNDNDEHTFTIHSLTGLKQWPHG